MVLGRYLMVGYLDPSGVVLGQLWPSGLGMQSGTM